MLSAFRALIDSGASLVVIEHNLDVIKTPITSSTSARGGIGGGQIVATGTPEKIAKSEHSTPEISKDLK